MSLTPSVSTAYPGDVITYTYQVHNTGDVALTNATVVDQRLGNGPLTATSLDLGAKATGTLQYAALEGDQPGKLLNTVDASGETPFGTLCQRTTITVVVPDRTYAVYLPLVTR